MSAAASDTQDQVIQFQLARETAWLSRDHRLQVDDPAMRAGMVEALSAYLEIWHKGCTPPDSVDWTNIDNNRAFLAQTVVMTVNLTLSIPSALKQERYDNYYKNAVTIQWPDGINGQTLVIGAAVARAVVFKAGGNPALAEDFVRFLSADGRLAHWLTFAGDRRFPPMRKLIEQPFWLDPDDPHRMRAAMQLLDEPHHFHTGVRGNERRSHRIWDENVWGTAVYRVIAEDITPEAAVDEAIVRIKEILSE